MNKVAINSRNKVVFINQEEIIFCKSENVYTFIHIEGIDPLLICRSLIKFSKELDFSLFIRVNRSYLVNKRFIISIDKKKKLLELPNNKKIPFTISLGKLMDLLGHKAATALITLTYATDLLSNNA